MAENIELEERHKAPEDICPLVSESNEDPPKSEVTLRCGTSAANKDKVLTKYTLHDKKLVIIYLQFPACFKA